MHLYSNGSTQAVWSLLNCVYLASFLAVWEVAVSGKASGSEGLPWVRMLWSLKGKGGHSY